MPHNKLLIRLWKIKAYGNGLINRTCSWRVFDVENDISYLNCKLYMQIGRSVAATEINSDSDLQKTTLKLFAKFTTKFNHMELNFLVS